jgi:hypothetical protein
MCLHADGGETFGSAGWDNDLREVTKVASGGWT